MLPGLDVSNFQGSPHDWRNAAGEISFAGVKISEFEPDGTRYVNPDAAADWAFLRDQRKGRIAYLFGHPSVSPGETVSLFLDTLEPMGVDDGDAVALDLETTDGRTPGQVSVWATAVMVILREHLRRSPLLYSFISFLEAGNCSGLSHYPLWLADISSPAGHPRVPAPWTTWAVHQFSWQPVDRDVANYGSLPAMQAALGRTPDDPRSRRDSDDMPSGTLLTPGPTPIRTEQRNIDPYSQLLLSSCKGAQAADLVVSILDADGSYDREVSVDWEHPGIVSFRHPRKTRAVSVLRKDAGTDPVAYLLT